MLNTLYNEIRSFRHDYINVLTSIQEGIELKDIEAIQEVYDNVLSKTKRIFQIVSTTSLIFLILRILQFKSVVSAKLLEAQSKNVEVHIEVESLVSLSNMDALDIITILSILLDNAIEAACFGRKCHVLNFGLFFQENDSDIIVVETLFEKKKSIFLKSLTWGTLQKERIEELVYQTCMTFWINILRPLLKQVAENIYLDKLLKSKEFVNFSELVSGIA